MSPRTEKQFKEIRKDKKELIIDTALELFAENGYHATSISSIAKDAGISKGLMYNYFESKELLLNEIILSGLKELIGFFDPNKDGFLTEDEFDFFLNSAIESIKNNRNYWKLYYSLMMQSSVIELSKDTMAEFTQQYFMTLIDYYKRHNSDNPEAEAMLLTTTLDGLAIAYVNDPEHFPIDEMKKLVIKKFKLN